MAYVVVITSQYEYCLLCSLSPPRLAILILDGREESQDTAATWSEQGMIAEQYALLLSSTEYSVCGTIKKVDAAASAN